MTAPFVFTLTCNVQNMPLLPGAFFILQDAPRHLIKVLLSKVIMVKAKGEVGGFPHFASLASIMGESSIISPQKGKREGDLVVIGVTVGLLMSWERDTPHVMKSNHRWFI